VLLRTLRRLCHFSPSAMTIFSVAHLTQRCQADWETYSQHAFVRQLGAASLPAEAFRHYLKQDYLFLLHFSRAWGLAVYKSRTMAELRQGLAALKAIVDIELDLHVQYCRQWGVSEADLATLPESRATTTYTRYVLDVGMQGDLLDLHIALAPCLLGYADIAAWLITQPFTVRGSDNPYEAWIAMYASDDFQAAAQAEREWLNLQLPQVSAARYDQLAQIFSQAAQLEADFWQMGLDLT